MNVKTHNGRLQIDTSLTWRILDGDAVIVSPQTGKIRVLNQVGAFIWQRIVNGCTLADILDALVDHFGVSPQQAQRDLTLFIDDLMQRKLVFWESAS
ncbi:MAG: PqqD family protein [Chloroflexi bacterium]|nr:PqqD family protein [Chloroflexota bacterium]